MKGFDVFNAKISTVCVVAVLLTACSTPEASTTRSPSVRRVDYGVSPQMKTLAERARVIGNQLYPGVCALLEDGKSRVPRRFDICFKKDLPNGNSGATRITQICLNARYLEEWKEDPATFDSVVVHEMAHVAQHYERPGDDASTYHYSVLRASQDSVWKLQRAWRTSADGSVIEEYPVP